LNTSRGRATADREITRWAGTTEVAFPVVVSALFDTAGVPARHPHGDRRAARPSQRHHGSQTCASGPTPICSAGIMAARSTSGDRARLDELTTRRRRERGRRAVIKQSCEMNDTANARKVILRAASIATGPERHPIRNCRRNSPKGSFESSGPA